MKKIIIATSLTLIILGLSGCLASTTSPIGPNCKSGVSLNDQPISCNGGN